MADFEDWRLRGDTETDLYNKNESMPSRLLRLVFDDVTGQYKGLKVGKKPGPTLYRDLPLDNVYTDEEKEKLDGIEAEAQKNVILSFNGRSTPNITPTAGDYNAEQIAETANAKIMTAAERSKLDSISPGAGELFQGNWNASTNTPTLAGSGMTPGNKWNVTTGGTQFTRAFTTGHFAIVDSAGDLQDVPSNTFTPGAGQYTTAWVDDSTDRRYVTDAQKTKIAALPDLSAPSTHVGAGGTEHTLATVSVAGFMAAADFAFLSTVGFVVSEAQPTLGDGKCWYKASTGRLHRWDATAARYWIIVAYAETIPPSTSNDIAAGFAKGCIWVDGGNNWVYVCRDNAAGAAKWEKVATPKAAALGGGTGLVGATAADGTLGVKSLNVAGVSGAPAISATATEITIDIPTRQTGADLVAAMAAELGPDWPEALGQNSQKVIITHVVQGNTYTYTDMPATETQVFGGAGTFKRNWLSALQIRFSRTVDVTFGAPASKLYLKYSIDAGATWTTIAGTDLALDGSNQFLAADWVDVPAGAKTSSTLVAVFSSGGDGAADPKIKNVMFEVSFPATTTAGVLSTPFQQNYPVLPGIAGWTATSPETEINEHARYPADLSRVTEIQYSVDCTVAATDGATRHVVKYSINGGTSWVEIPGTAVALNVTGGLMSGWVELPAAARIAGAWVSIWGGNASLAGQTATFNHAVISTRYRTVTPLLDAAPLLLWQPDTLNNASTLNWTAVPPGTALEVNGRMRCWRDTTLAQKVIFRCHVMVAGRAASVGYIQYSLDAVTWSTLSGSAIAIDATGQKDTGEIVLPGDALAPVCWFRFVADVPGSGTTAFGFGLTTLDIGANIFAEVPWLSEGDAGGTFRGPSQTITESGQAIQAETVFLRGNAAAVPLPPISSGINICAVYCGRSTPSNLKPTGAEVIDGVGPTGQDIQPYKWATFIRDSGAVPSMWVEKP